MRLARGALRRRQPDGEQGFSLVEVLVAMVIFMIVMSALLMGLAGAVKATKGSELRTGASQLLQQRLEQLQAVGYGDQLGFYASDPGYVATAGGEPTVTLTGTRAVACPTGVLSATAPEPVPACPVVRRLIGGITYTVTTSVTWSNRSSATSASPSPLPTTLTGSPATPAYKRLQAVVAWADANGPRSQRMEALRTPTSTEVVPLAGPASPAASPTAAASTAPIAAGVLTASPAEQTLSSGKLTASIVVDYTSNYPVTAVEGSYANGELQSESFLLTEVSGSGGLRWGHTIPSGTDGFVGGAFTFSVTSDAPIPDTRSSVTVQLFDNIYVPVTLGTPSISPALCVNHNRDELIRNSQVSVRVTGIQATDPAYVTFSNSDYAGSWWAATHAPAPDGSRTITYTVTTGKKFTANSTTFTVATRRGTGSWVTRQQSFTVLESKNGGPCGTQS